MIIPNIHRSVSLARPVLSCAHYFQAPVTQASTEVTADTYRVCIHLRDKFDPCLVNRLDEQVGFMQLLVHMNFIITLPF